MQDLSWSLHHKQLYSHQNPRPPLNNFILFSTLNLLNKPRAFCHFIYTYIYIYFDLFFPITPSFFVKIVLCWACLSRESVYDPKNKQTNKRENPLLETYKAIMKRTYAHTHTHSHDINTVWKETFSHESRVDTHTHASSFGHRFKPLQRLHRKLPPRDFVCVNLSVCFLFCLSLAVRRVKEFRQRLASHWFHSISNSYLAHLTTIK